MSLKNRIALEINKSGPITISRFMEHCLYDKQFGYYKSKAQTIGSLGDFITAPEISQVFGELIGIWLAQTWVDRGKPVPFSLVELGPGNGTMMRDILTALKKIPELAKSASIVLVETSKTLKGRQKTLLKDYDPSWVQTVLEIPEQPLFVIGNEFLDALPIRQFKKNDNRWYERAVSISNNDELYFTYEPSNFNIELNTLYNDVPNGVIVERSDIATNILSDLSEKMQRNGGVSLFIDYGYENGFGDTLQALNQHSFSDPLANLGETDLTSHVNFRNIFNLVRRKGLRASELQNQRSFLLGLGILERAEILAKKMSEKQKELHYNAINRLIDSDQMGNLFKVIGFTNINSPLLPILE